MGAGYKRLAHYAAIALAIGVGLAGGTLIAVGIVLILTYWGV